jgi:hypothetical protein
VVQHGTVLLAIDRRFGMPSCLAQTTFLVPTLDTSLKLTTKKKEEF